jgi:hypothetical protein
MKSACHSMARPISMLPARKTDDLMISGQVGDLQLANSMLGVGADMALVSKKKTVSRV